MTLRRIFLTATALGALAFTTTLPAQEAKNKGKGGGMGNPEQIVARLDEHLSLTADQKTKITAIYAKSREKMQAIPQEERREKGREIMQAVERDVRALLTPEQQAKFDAMPRGRGPGKGEGKAEGKKKNKDQ